MYPVDKMKFRERRSCLKPQSQKKKFCSESLFAYSICVSNEERRLAMKYKLEYIPANIEIIRFEPIDIVTSSGNITDDGNVDSGGWTPTNRSW